MPDPQNHNYAPITYLVFQFLGKDTALKMLLDTIRDHAIYCAMDEDTGTPVAERLHMLFELYEAIRQM
jgi:hypothetical protein